MMIRHEAPDPAFAFRVQAPLLIQTGPEAFLEVREWSPEGMRVPEGWPEDGGGGTLTIPFGGIFLSFDLDLPAARPGDFAPFLGLNGRARALLRLVHGEVLSGRMTEVDGVLRAIDRPVDLVPMTETEEDGGRVPTAPRRRLGQTLRAAGLYLVLGLLVWTALWSQAWERLTTLPLQSGRFETHTAEIARATGTGWIDHRHATRVFVGMGATLSINAGGRVLHLPAVVAEVHADREPEGRAKSGYIVTVVANTADLDPAQRLPIPARAGSPAEILLHAPFLLSGDQIAQGQAAMMVLADQLAPDAE